MKSVLDNNQYFGQPTLFSAATLQPLPIDFERYDDKVMYATISPYLKKGNTILDLGCGYASNLPKSYLTLGCKYYGIDENYSRLIDLRNDLKKSFPKKRYFLSTAEIAEDLPHFKDNSFDVVMMKSSLLHIPVEDRDEVLRQAHRVARKALIIQEYTWSRVGNVTNEKVFKAFSRACAQLLTSHGTDGYLYQKLPAVLVEALPNTKMEVFRIDDRPEADYREEFETHCINSHHCAWNCYSGDDEEKVRKAIADMIELCEAGSLAFTPPAVVMAHIPK